MSLDQQQRAHPSLPGVGPVLAGTRPPPSRPSADLDGFDVQSVFDVRPVGALEFNFTGSFSIGLYTPLAFVTVVVPTGYVAVLRRFRYAANGDVFASVIVDGNPDPHQSNLDLGLIQPTDVQVYALGDENQAIGVAFRSPTGTRDGTALIGGTYLPKRGASRQNDISSPRAPSAGEIARSMIAELRKWTGK